MLFVEVRFFLFFALVFAAYWALSGQKSRKLLLLVASCAFYAAWDWRFLSLIFTSAVVDFAAARGIRSTQDESVRKRWLAASIVVNLTILGFFKYFDFFMESVAQAASEIGLGFSPRTLRIVLPVGISFYTFQSMSYSIDVYRRRLDTLPSLLDFGLFVSFFPQLVAGPIVRAREFLPQLQVTHRFTDVDVRRYLLLFLSGFIKKTVVADRLAVAVDPVFAAPEQFTIGAKWLAAGLYHVQIYCDFSGYTDMAIALAGMLGFRLTANFDFPYLAGSIREFWRRWHISLSSWFRDYLYLSMGGNRGSAYRTARNLLVVFLLCGLWHGAAWTFIVWGLFHGALLVLERGPFGGWLARRPFGLRLVYVQLSAVVAWVFFRSPDLATALDYLQGMAGVSTGGSVGLDPGWAVFLLALAGIHVGMYWMRDHLSPERWPGWAFGFAYGGAAAAVLPWISTRHVPFIYFQF
jgi:alginate O-acetyltransferase complex protein AlgI